MSSTNFSSLTSSQIQGEESILSFHVTEDDEEIDDDIPEDNLVKYQNTYRMESKNPFDEYKVMVLVKNETEKYLNEKTKYDPYDATRICTALSVNIRIGINDMDFDRYKIICMVQIVEKRSQGIFSVVRFLRDLKKDMYVKSEFENNNLFATVVVAAIYYE